MRVAVYTTFFAAIRDYIPPFCASLLAQEDKGFHLFIGDDGADTAQLSTLHESGLAITTITRVEGDTPASLRSRAWQQITGQFDAVVLCDADDIMYPSRVAAAVQGLDNADLCGCELALIDEQGRDTGNLFGPAAGQDPLDLLPRFNAFGLSNTAWRCTTLRTLLPVPATVTLVDWHLATRAWGQGARISYDRTCRVGYRQHAHNTARVLPPFTAEQIVRASVLVKTHHEQLQPHLGTFVAERRARLEHAADRCQRFTRAIHDDPELLATYTRQLNALPAHRLWWMTVAHPDLEQTWNA